VSGIVLEVCREFDLMIHDITMTEGWTFNSLSGRDMCFFIEMVNTDKEKIIHVLKTIAQAVHRSEYLREMLLKQLDVTETDVIDIDA
jgi:hypothetical protein